ncbi:RND family efflux transporter, MFP subunit [Pseudoxanthobacter soli DSM 19599]|uniref:RND family efflux transporter, MFP subunit n=1 Tax=Pseudoxanthobacter soli DSM 19599 TaxID=1123029 RepID=A0A1M7ZL21_9HYPH|nr:efflux RND transporter periplasmic adaptor subunit [Pseudoxanthobacter soli]SHO65584.1 RND family efflux transporter, MFP subunit [Pseudoxanthobacter soli DSM 19599]
MVRNSAISLGVVGLALAVAACKPEQVASKPDPVVRVTTAFSAPDAEVRSYTGVIRPRTEIAQAFRVGGRVVERLVDVGDTVKQGQVLARLDPTDFALSVESAEAELTAAQSALVLANAEEGRFEELLKGGHTSQASYDARKVALDEARARVDRDERALDLARNQLGYAVLTSNVDGVVTSATVEAGQVVGQGQEIVKVAKQAEPAQAAGGTAAGGSKGAEKEVLVAIPESRLADLDRSAATVTLWADGGRQYAATVREIAPQADPATRTYAVRFSLPDADDAVRLGMTATLALASGSDRPVVRLPLSAVFSVGEGAGVYVVKRDPEETGHGVLAFQPVEIVRYGSNEAVVTGVPHGAAVVAMGARRLENGERVRFEASAQSAPQPDAAAAATPGLASRS